MHRVTMNLDEDIVSKAAAYAPGKTRTELVHAGLHALIRERARDQLLALHGAFPDVKTPGRRRWDPETGEDVVDE